MPLRCPRCGRAARPNGGTLSKDGTNYIEDAQGLTLPVPIGSMAIVPNDHNTMYVATGVADLAFDSRPGSGIWCCRTSSRATTRR